MLLLKTPRAGDLPWGCVDASADTGLVVTSQLATTLNWRTDAHSDWCDVVNHRDLKERQWFPKIYKWYNKFLGEEINKDNPAVPIGKEF